MGFHAPALIVIHKHPRDIVILESAEDFSVGRAVRALGVQRSKKAGFSLSQVDVEQLDALTLLKLVSCAL